MAVCSALLSACERDLDQALRFVDDMHSSGYSHSPDFYAKLLERCGFSLGGCMSALERVCVWWLALNSFSGARVAMTCCCCSACVPIRLLWDG